MWSDESVPTQKCRVPITCHCTLKKLAKKRQFVCDLVKNPSGGPCFFFPEGWGGGHWHGGSIGMGYTGRARFQVITSQLLISQQAHGEPLLLALTLSAPCASHAHVPSKPSEDVIDILGFRCNVIPVSCLTPCQTPTFPRTVAVLMSECALKAPMVLFCMEISDGPVKIVRWTRMLKLFRQRDPWY